jgi:hypothetical protein
VRTGLGDPGSVNIWRLPTVIGLTWSQLSASNDPFHKRVIDEVVGAAQPGIWEAIALLVLNVGALLLAAPSGGATLAVAAGVNAVVAGEHVKEYLVQSALAGTAFDRAKGLSQDEPSFFWLAVELVGVGIDSVVAFKTIAEAAKAVQAAKEAGDAAKVAARMEELRQAARGAGGEELAQKVVAHLGEGGGADAEAMKALGVSEAEMKSLGKAGQMAEEELGAAGQSAASGGAKISKAGHIFSCASPCTWMREKFASLLGPDITLEGETTTLRQQYLAFEERAAAAAKQVELAKGPEELAKAQEVADALEKEIGAFNTKLTREMRGRQIDTAVQVLGQDKRFAILQSAGLDRAAVERVLAKAGNLDQMKGQLLEELLANRVRGMLGTEAGRAALAGSKAAAPLEFVDGFRITDELRQQLSDGMILAQEGDHYRVVTVFESKAGGASSRGLSYRYKSLKDMKPDELDILRNEAIEELREQSKPLAGMSQDDILKHHKALVEDTMDKLRKGEAGQIRKDIERLVPNEGSKTTTILVDGKPRQVVAGSRSTKTVGALPSDVSGTRLAERVHAQGLESFEAMNLDIKQADLQALAQSLADELAAASSPGAPALATSPAGAAPLATPPPAAP